MKLRCWMTAFGDPSEASRPLTPELICATWQVTTDPNTGWGMALHQGSYNEAQGAAPRHACSVCCPAVP